MSTDTNELIERARAGDRSAMEPLLERHRDRLRRMIDLRMDRRIVARVDASDVVQETLTEAARRLPDLVQRDIPLYICLRRIAWEQLLQTQRKHIGAKKRSVEREVNGPMLSDASATLFAGQFKGRDSTPSCKAMRRELRLRVQEALSELSEASREVLLMRHLEQLSIEETAAALGIASEAARSRYRRALEQLHHKLSDVQD